MLKTMPPLVPPFVLAFVPPLVLAFVLALAAAASAAAGELKPWTASGPTPALSLNDLTGKPHQLADYKGKVVLINFWATWCEPCRDEMPALQELHRRMADVPFVILAVDMGEGEARIKEFLHKMPVDFTILLDRDMSVTKAWKVRVLPYSFVLDPSQKIRYGVLGDLDWAAPDVEAKLRALLPRASGVH